MVLKEEKWGREGPLAISKTVSCATVSKRASSTSLAFKTKQTLETLSWAGSTVHPGESKVLSTAPFPQKRSASRPYATLGTKRILTLSEMSESPYKLCLYSTAPFPLAGKKFLSLRSVYYPRSSALHGKGVGGGVQTSAESTWELRNGTSTCSHAGWILH